MKTTSKILILALSLFIAIGGVLVYAKTKVEPPMALKQKDAYAIALNECMESFYHTEDAAQEDSLFAITADRISVFKSEEKISASEADKDISSLLGRYTQLFLNRSFEKFRQSTWHDTDHKYMLSVIHNIKSIKRSDNSSALAQSTIDSLNLISNIIDKYHKALAVSRHTAFSGCSNAQNTISQARQYAKDEWLSNCSDLVAALNNVKQRLAQSHYNYISAQVEKLQNYRYYSQSYYDDTLVPQVDASVTEYENKATSLYGAKRDVNVLWNKARNYYNEASSYYQYHN